MPFTVDPEDEISVYSKSEVDQLIADISPASTPTDEQVSAAVAAYMLANPVTGGSGPTDEQVSAAVAAYMLANPVVAPGPTDAQVSAAVVAYLSVNPVVVPGPTGAQVSAAVATYMAAHPVAAPGPTDAQVSASVSAYMSGHPVTSNLGVVVVNTGTEARPSGPTVVLWVDMRAIGSTRPVNLGNTDLWFSAGA